MISRIAHVCVHVRDLQKTLDFYQRVLGLRQKFRFLKSDRHAGGYFEVGDRNFLEFFVVDQKSDTVNNGITHFCLETNELDKLMAHLDEQEIPYTPKVLGSDSSYQIWITDPDGNRIEIHEYTEASSQFTGQDALITW